MKKNIYRTFIIAEVGLNHLGNFRLAKKYINDFSKAGVDAIKFQAHMAEYESSNQEKFRVKFSKKYKNRFDYWKKTSFNKEQWKKLFYYSKKKKIIFGASVFCEEALDLFENGKYLDFIKIPSGETNTLSLLKKIKKLNKKTIISTGLSNWKEIDILSKIFKSKKKTVFLQCTSKYPTPLNEVGFNVINKIKSKYKYKCGLSDHTGNINTCLYSIFKKVDYLEFHVKLNSKGNFPDKNISLSIEETKRITDARKDLLKLQNPVNKNEIYHSLLATKEMFGKSLALNKDINKNHLIKLSDLTLRKPGNGIKQKDIKKILNKRSKKDLKKNNIISYNDFR